MSVSNKMFANMKHFKKQSLAIVTAMAVTHLAFADAVLKDINYSVQPGDKVEVRLKMSEAFEQPSAFTTENPANLSFDFTGVTSDLKKKFQKIGVGSVRSVTAVEAGGRTRVVFKLANSVPYTTSVDGSEFVILLGDNRQVQSQPSATKVVTDGVRVKEVYRKQITGVDFRRGEQGEGRVMVDLNDPNAIVDLKQEADKIIVDFVDVSVEQSLIRRLDVVDFATPVRTFEVKKVGNVTRLIIDTLDDYEHIAYQTETGFTVDLKPLTPQEKEKRAEQRFQYTGQKMSLNFQDIEVRAVLQLIADLTDLNLIASDSVQGNITLRLQDVPWDQALDIILRTKGLDKRQQGNVMLVAPADELAAQEKLMLTNQEEVKELAPLYIEYIPIKYAKAADLAALINGSFRATGTFSSKGSKSEVTVTSNEKEDGKTLLSERGHVTVDERTNTLIVRDTQANIASVRELLVELDVPVEQVLIEARIVNASDNFSESLGVRFGLTEASSTVGISGNLTGANNARNDVESVALTDRLNVGLATAAAGSIGVSIGKIADGTILDLELTAAETEGMTEIIGSPKVMTTNQSTAVIEAGKEIPYATSSANGATTIEFKKAVTSLEVTPQITPDDRLILDITIKADNVGDVVPTGAGNAVGIDTQEINTQVLIENGETVVLGGIFNVTKQKSSSKVPLLGDLPAVGRLFRSDVESETKQELLIFITPKIIKQSVR